MKKTEKGTELPILKVKGKDYLAVQWRVVWFREEKPEWSIETEVKYDKEFAIGKATIRNELNRIIATAHKTETPQGFPDYIEKSETGAIGRALALCGYGTQFTTELDEDNRIVDAPVAGPESNMDFSPSDVTSPVSNDGPPFDNWDSELKQSFNTMVEEGARENIGSFMVSFGKKYSGKQLKEIPTVELRNYLQWIKSEQKPGKPPYAKVAEFITAAEAFLSL